MEQRNTSSILADHAVLVSLVVLTILGVLLVNWRAASGQKAAGPVNVVFLSQKVLPAVATSIRKGDPVVVAPGGMRVGIVRRVVVTPHKEVTASADGRLVLARDPYYMDVEITFVGEGRVSPTLVALKNQIVQAGMPFTLVSADYSVTGQIVAVSSLRQGAEAN